MKVFSVVIVALFTLLFISCGDKSNKVLKSLSKNNIVYSNNAECMLNCLNVSKKEIRTLLDSGSVDFDSSNMKGKCPIYIIKGQGDNDLKVTVSACDSTTNILQVKRTSIQDSCSCN